MADEQETPEAAQEESKKDAGQEKDDQNERQKRDVQAVARSLLGSAFRQRLSEEGGNPKPPHTPEEEVLTLYHRLASEQKLHVLIPKDAEGHDILPPEIAGEDATGKPFRYTRGEIRIAGIVDSTDDDIVCFFADTKRDNVVKDSAGNRIQLALPKETVLDAQLLSDRERYERLFSGPRQELMKTYLASLDALTSDEQKTFTFPPQTDGVIEQAAQAAGMLTVGTITESTLFREMGEQEQKKLRESIQGAVLLDKEDFHKFLTAAGIGTDGVAAQLPEAIKKAGEMQAELGTLESTGGRDTPEYKALEKLLEKQRATVELLGMANEIWEKTAKEGKTPFDDYYDKAAKGELPQGEVVRLLEAFKKGDITAIVENLPGLQLPEHADAETKKELEKKRIAVSNAVKIAATGGLGLAAILLIVAGTLSMFGLQQFGKTMNPSN